MKIKIYKCIQYWNWVIKQTRSRVMSFHPFDGEGITSYMSAFTPVSVIERWLKVGPITDFRVSVGRKAMADCRLLIQ